MAIIHNIDLFVDKQRFRYDEEVVVRVGDVSSQSVRATLYASKGVLWTIPDGATAKLEIQKADGTWSVSSASINTSNSYVTGSIPAKGISTPGLCKRAYFRIIDGSAEYTTEDFKLYVFPNATQEAIEASNFTDEFEALLESSNVALMNAIESVSTISREIGDFSDVPTDGMWDVGYLNPDSGAYNGSNQELNISRKAMRSFVDVKRGSIISCSDGYKFYVCLYETGGTPFIKATPATGATNGPFFEAGIEYVVEQDCSIRVCAAKADGTSEITVSEAETAILIESIGDGISERVGNVEQGISELKGELDSNVYYDSDVDPDWQSGYLAIANGAYNGGTSWSQKMACTRAFMPAKKGSSVSVASGYMFYVCVYDSSNTFQYTTPAQTLSGGPYIQSGDRYTVEEDCVIRVCVTRTDKSTGFTPEEGAGATSLSLYSESVKDRIEEVAQGVGAGIVALNKDVRSILPHANRRRNASRNEYQSLPEVLTLLHFSDPHDMGDNNYVRLQQFRDEYSDQLKDTLCTGDIALERFSDGVGKLATQTDGSILTCVGNHDVLNVPSGQPSDWTQVASQQDLYDVFVSPFASDWGSDAHTVSGHPYYYKDYPECEMRLVVIDSNIWDETERASQVTWLEGVLASAKTAGYAIVIASHYPPNKRVNIECPFTTTLHPSAPASVDTTYAWGTYYPALMDAVQDFIDGDGNFACWLAGHTHYDLVCYCADYPSQLFVVVTTAKLQNAYCDGERKLGDKSQDAFNIASIDKTTKLVKLARVGQDRDHLLRHMGTLTLDYSTAPATVVNFD